LCAASSVTFALLNSFNKYADVVSPESSFRMEQTHSGENKSWPGADSCRSWSAYRF
jgi:hypothetical protein